MGWRKRERAHWRALLSSQTPHFGRRTHWPPPVCVCVCVGQVSERDTPSTAQPHTPERDERERRQGSSERSLKKARHNVQRLRTRQLSSRTATPKRAPPASHSLTHSHTARRAKHKTSERDVKAPAREALKRRDTTSSGSERVSSRAGRPRQNELRQRATHSHTHTQLVEPNTRRACAQVTKRGAKESAPSGSEPRVKAPRVGGLSTTRPKGLGLRPKGLGGTKGSLQVVQALGLRPQGLEASQLPRVIKA